MCKTEKLKQNALKLQRLYDDLSKSNDITNKDLQQLVELLSVQHFGESFKHYAYFNPRLKTTGGRYHLNSHDLDFNKLIFECHGLEEFKKVILHELCHYHLHIKGAGYRHCDNDFKVLLKQTGGSRFAPTLPLKKEVRLKLYTCQQCGQLYKRQRYLNVKKFGCQCGGRLDLQN